MNQQIIAGCMGWGKWGKDLSISQMSELILLYLSQDINTFDHADIYGAYTTENDFGVALKQSGVARENIKLITKCGIQHTQGRNNTIKHYNYSKEYIIWSAENSLKNLQTDYLDILLLHRPSPLLHAEEVAEAIETLKSQGKIRAFGVSNFTPAQTALLHQYSTVSCNQIQFSVTHHQPLTDGSLDYMQLHKIQPMAWNPLGDIFRTDTEKVLRIRQVLIALEDKYNTTTDVLLLAWIFKHPAQIQPVVGTANQEHIKRLTQLSQIKLELEDWFMLYSASLGERVP